MTTPTAEPNEKGSPSLRGSTSSRLRRPSVDTVSPGVARIGAAAEHITTANRVCILFSVLLLAWAFGLDAVLRTGYHAIAVNALHAQAQLATVSVVKAVTAAAVQVCHGMLASAKVRVNHR